MKITWLDIQEIAIELSDAYPDENPQWISFPDLHKKICNLKNFDDDPKKLSNIAINFLLSHLFRCW